MFSWYLSLSFASFFNIFDLKKWIFGTLTRIRDTLQEEMAFSKNIKRICKISFKYSMKLLRPIHFDSVVIYGREILAKPTVNEQVKTLLKRLTSGH
jgi:predicted house-cleaning NTP pyrophosphatase (Maf/HAM1 superfamily)